MYQVINKIRIFYLIGGKRHSPYKDCKGGQLKTFYQLTGKLDRSDIERHEPNL